MYPSGPSHWCPEQNGRIFRNVVYGTKLPFLSENVDFKFGCIKIFVVLLFQLHCWPLQFLMFQWKNGKMGVSGAEHHRPLTPILCVVFKVVANQGNAYWFHFVSSFLFLPFSELPQWQNRFPANGHALHRHQSQVRQNSSFITAFYLITCCSTNSW